MRKIITVASIIIFVVTVGWRFFINKPSFLNKIFPQKMAEETTVGALNFSGQLFEESINPYEEAYTNPFE
jgi:hypothetical protein